MELVLKDTHSALTVSKTTFCCDFNEALVHQVVIAYKSGARQGTSAQKTRAEVTGSSKKPWRQKGTGRARSGSIKSPIWRSGGVTFAALPQQDYSKKVNKKMYRGAIKSILSELIRQNRFIVVDTLSVNAPKTKLLAHKLKNMAIAIKNILIIISNSNKDKNLNLLLAARNLHKVYVRYATAIDPVSLISCCKVVITADAVKQLEEMLK